MGHVVRYMTLAYTITNRKKKKKKTIPKQVGETKRAGFKDGREFWRGAAWESSVREEWLKEMHNLLEKEKKREMFRFKKKKVCLSIWSEWGLAQVGED